MKKYVKYVLTFLLIVSLFFFLFVLKNNKIVNTLIALIVFLIFILRVSKYRRPVPQRKSDELFIVIGFSILFLGITFLYSFIFGKGTQFAVVLQKYDTVLKWFVIFVILIVTEIIRYLLMSCYDRNDNKEKIYYILTFIVFVMIDLIVSPRVYVLNGAESIYEFLGVFAIQSISKNILLNYLSFTFGYVPCIWYRILIDLFPFEPQINALIYSVLVFILPFIMYFTIKSIYAKKKKNKNKVTKKQNSRVENVYTCILVIFLSVLIYLVSCEFSYGMIAVGSESMTGTINKGDAVIYERFDRNNDKLDVGDVIIFKKNDIMVVHRIHKKNIDNGLNIYQTKGDANTSVDNWTVDDSEIVGVVRMRVLFIAWPSVWLSELF